MQVLNSFLSMRQACCHPEVAGERVISRVHRPGTQVTTGTRARGARGNQAASILTMAELLERMTSKVRVECVDHHRSVTAALNGQAACHIIKGQVG